MRIICLLLLAILYQSPVVIAQNPTAIDSLLQSLRTQENDTSKIRTLNSIVRHYMYRDRDKAKEFATQQLSLATELNDTSAMSLAHYQFGSIYYDQSLRDSIEYHYGKALEYGRVVKDHVQISQAMSGLAMLEFSEGNMDKAEAMNEENLEINLAAADTMGFAINYEFKARVNQNRGYYKIALENILKAHEFYKILGDDLRMADALTLMGTLEINFGNLDKAIEYQQEAYTIYEANEDKYFQAGLLNDIGVCYLRNKDYSSALQYFNQSTNLSKSIDYKYMLASSLHNTGRAKLESGMPSEARSYFEQAIRAAQPINAQRKIALSKRRLAEAYADLGDPRKALVVINEAIEYNRSSNNASMEGAALETRSDIYTSLGDHRNALADYKQAKTIKDSLFGVEQSRQTEEMRAMFDLERKEQQLAIQQNEIALLEQQKEINRQNNMILGLGLILLLVLSGAGLSFFLQKVKRNRLEKEKLDAELDHKKKELTSHALHLAKKNEVLVSLKEQVESLKANGNGSDYRSLLNTINFDLKDEENWDQFMQYFEQVHRNFSKEVQQKFPNITPGELRLMALLKMNLSSKEIATMLNITSDGVKKARQRLRKKLELSPEESLEATVLTL